MKSLRLPKLLLSLLFISSSFFAGAQERTVSGKVLDQQANTPLEGVSVKVKNSQVATTTNAAGEFRIKVPSAGSILVFSYIGFGAYEINSMK